MLKSTFSRFNYFKIRFYKLD